MAQLLKHNLLIVDDDEDTRRLLMQIFIARGLNVRIAKDGFEALERIRNGRPEILLSDLNMPGMSGFELLSVVRRQTCPACSGQTAGFRVGHCESAPVPRSHPLQFAHSIHER